MPTACSPIRWPIAPLLILLLLLGAWGLRLHRTLAWARMDPRQACVWVAALAGWSVTVFAGLLNTTLHHEHGLLALATLGLLLSISGRGDPAPPSAGPAGADGGAQRW